MQNSSKMIRRLHPQTSPFPPLAACMRGRFNSLKTSITWIWNNSISFWSQFIEKQFSMKRLRWYSCEADRYQKRLISIESAFDTMQRHAFLLFQGTATYLFVPFLLSRCQILKFLVLLHTLMCFYLLLGAVLWNFCSPEPCKWTFLCFVFFYLTLVALWLN